MTLIACMKAVSFTKYIIVNEKLELLINVCFVYLLMHVKVTRCNKALLQGIMNLEVEMRLKFADFNLLAPSEVTCPICIII